MKVSFSSFTRMAVAFLLLLSLSSCANFRKLREDLKLFEQSYTLAVQLENADTFESPIRAFIFHRESEDGELRSVDRVLVSLHGRFAFLVDEPDNCYVGAYVDLNENERYDAGEPLWQHGGAVGAAVVFDPDSRRAELRGHLDANEELMPELHSLADRFLAGRDVDSVLVGRGVTLTLGKVVDPASSMFSAQRGADGLWSSSEFLFDGGFGIYFMAEYDPDKIPLLFVHGAGGTPQVFKGFFDEIDRRHFQIWFYSYPTGARLEQSARALNQGIEALHQKYQFESLHIVAHSMGGLVARRSVLDNVAGEGTYIKTLITISSPFGGHEAAESGVKRAPSVVPSWRDMVRGSDYQKDLYREQLKGAIDHYLFFTYNGAGSYVLPTSNDGVVSVASQLLPAAQEDAVTVFGYDEGHVSILSNPDLIERVEAVCSR